MGNEPTTPSRLISEVERHISLVRASIEHAYDEAARYRAALEEMAKNGCGVAKPGQLKCYESYADRSDWCWSCIAVVTLAPPDAYPPLGSVSQTDDETA